MKRLTIFEDESIGQGVEGYLLDYFSGVMLALRIGYGTKGNIKAPI